MTVLETEENADKRSVPPRKKFCLSLSGRRRAVPIVDPQPPPTSTRGGLLDRTDFSFSMYISFCLFATASCHTVLVIDVQSRRSTSLINDFFMKVQQAKC